MEPREENCLFGSLLYDMKYADRNYNLFIVLLSVRFRATIRLFDSPKRSFPTTGQNLQTCLVTLPFASAVRTNISRIEYNSLSSIVILFDFIHPLITASALDAQSVSNHQ